MPSDTWSIVRAKVTRVGAKWEDLTAQSAVITAEGQPGALFVERLGGGGVEIRSDRDSWWFRGTDVNGQLVNRILLVLAEEQPGTAAFVARARSGTRPGLLPIPPRPEGK